MQKTHFAPLCTAALLMAVVGTVKASHIELEKFKGTKIKTIKVERGHSSSKINATKATSKNERFSGSRSWGGQQTGAIKLKLAAGSDFSAIQGELIDLKLEKVFASEGLVIVKAKQGVDVDAVAASLRALSQVSSATPEVVFNLYQPE